MSGIYTTTVLVVCFSIIFVIVILIVAVTMILRGVRFSSRSSLGQIVNAIQQADDEQMMTPKTVSGAEPVYRQMIARDFPEFNLELARSYISGALSEFFHAKATRNAGVLRDNCTAQYCDALQSQFNNEKLTNKPAENYTNIKVHRVVVSNYLRNGEEAQITFEAAVGYALNGRPSQHKYKANYTYFLSYGARGENESLKCSNCGAPIESIGVKVCPYCSEVIEASVERTWKITDISMVI
ncbi:MAG: zinc ribbon domain-containing protein [Ruminococcus sp.]|nr:zinc ribbon domain-containing protein [Ruminococcus sp.]